MIRGQNGVDVQEYEKVSPGHPGPGIHLGSPAPGRNQEAHPGKAGRHFPGGVGAAAVRQDNFQVR